MNGKGRLLMSVAVIFIVGVVSIYFFRDHMKSTFPELVGFFESGANGSRVTYYQWTSPSGEMIISKEKPSTGVQFISFEANKDLLKDENNVDADLVNRGNKYRNQSVKRTKDDATTATNSNKISPSSEVFPFSAISKTKRCVNLSNQISNARNQQKDTSALKKKYAKEC